MPEILRDPVWQFIGATFAFAAVVVAIFLYWMQRQRKALSYEIISRTPLLSMEEEVQGKLQILFDDKLVQGVHLVAVRIINSGNVPIVSADYERPVNLSFGENTQILTAEVSETNPEILRATAAIEDTKVVLAPVLLNSEDSITLKILVSQFDGQISVDGRIVGVKGIRKSVDGRAQYFVLPIGGMVLAVVSLALWMRTLPRCLPSPEKLTPSWPYLMIALLGCILAIIGSLRNSRLIWEKNP